MVAGGRDRLISRYARAPMLPGGRGSRDRALDPRAGAAYGTID
jgi:hypothetical protein